MSSSMQLYNKAEAIERIDSLAQANKPFIFIIDYEHNRSYIEEPAGIDPGMLLYNLNGFTNCEEYTPLLEKEVHWKTFPISYPDYKRSFDVVWKNIHGGNSFLTNLTCRTPVMTNLTTKEVFFYSKALYKLWIKDQFVVFSPEIFVRIKDGTIYSYPMKGTIDAEVPSAEERLMNDKKEAAEHATIVDLIRNDLSMVADKVSVKRYRYIDRIQTNQGAILQTSSEISGRLPKQYLHTLGSMLFRLLPAGSITGAPKRKTMEIIDLAESCKRGFYTGIMGYFDGQNLDSAVMIRFIEENGGRLFFKSGGGITCRSEAMSEYNEMMQKVYVPIY